jgi:hypothetical protein
MTSSGPYFSELDKIFVSSPDEFFNEFYPTGFSDISIINKIKSIISFNTKIGQGGVGSVFDPGPDTNYLIKVSKICPPNAHSTLLGRLCDHARKGDMIYRIPNTQLNKTTLLAPNYILEPLIGIQLTHKLKRHTLSFMDVYDFQYDFSDPEYPVYSIVEKLQPLLDKLYPPKEYYYTLFHLTHALNVAQKCMRYTHFDLHKGNVMSRDVTGKVIVTPLDNGMYVYTYNTYVPVIIDYGHNRIETEETILAPNLHFHTRNREMVDFYFFNPYYDLYSFLRTTTEFSGDPRILFSEFFNLDPTTTSDVEIAELRTYIEGDVYATDKNWRSNPEKLATAIKLASGLELYGACTPSEFLTTIVSHITTVLRDMPKYYNHNNQLIADYLVNNGFWVSDQLIDLRGKNSLITDVVVLQPVPKSKQMDTTYLNYFSIPELEQPPVIDNSFDNVEILSTSIIVNENNHPIFDVNYHPEYQFTPSAKTVANDSFIIPKLPPWIHIAFIDQSAGLKNGYSFKFDCCRLDLRNYLQSRNIHSGVAINASFFNIRDNFFPVGYFKTDGFVSDLPVPEPYSKYFGIIGISRNGLLFIDEQKNRRRYSKVVTSGPVLVSGGEPAITPDTLRDSVIEVTEEGVVKYAKTFQSRNPIPGQNEDRNSGVFSDGDT